MSLILDALNRSQDERRGDAEVPGLETRHYPVPEQTRSTPVMWVVGLVLLAALLGLAAYLLLAREVAPEVVVATPEELPSEAPIERTEPVVESVPDPVRLSLPTQAAARGGEVAALYSQAAAAQKPSPAEAAEPKVAAKAPAETRPAEPVKPQTVASNPPVEEAVDLEQMVAIAEQEMENQRLQEHDAPFLSELSQQRKDAIPTLLYSRHDYAGDARRSSVVINGKTLRAGSQVAPGIQLDEVLPDSAVFSFRGEQFRLAALNSWVNL